MQSRGAAIQQEQHACFKRHRILFRTGAVPREQVRKVLEEETFEAGVIIMNQAARQIQSTLVSGVG